MKPLSKSRIQSIDIFRALTMFFMIFVNDLPTLKSYPKWLGHMPADYDGMGFSDVIFPAFLFIVGLSIPFAFRARLKKGDSKVSLIWHILQRSFALIVMGFFMVNLENINEELLVLDKSWWMILMTLAFFLIWNNYPDKKAFGRVPQWIMMLAGWIILGVLALLYKGGTIADPTWMQTHWWGILGLIGWAYLLCSLVYLWIGQKFWLMLLSLLILYLLNVQEFVELIGSFSGFKIVVSASNHASVMSGVIVTLIYIRFRENGQTSRFILFSFLLGCALLFFGFLTRPEWGISKIFATPSWTAVCVGISTFTFLILFVIADLFQKTNWAKVLAPAGRSTLTCYLVPYFVYGIWWLSDFTLPIALQTGWLGILKCLVFSFVIIQMTWVLERINIRLKI